MSLANFNGDALHFRSLKGGLLGSNLGHWQTVVNSWLQCCLLQLHSNLEVQLMEDSEAFKLERRATNACYTLSSSNSQLVCFGERPLVR